jgi:hypothetical protein
MRITLSAAGRVRTVLGVAVLTALLLSRSGEAVASFPDVPPSDPSYTAVTGLAAKGAIGGFDDGTFRPHSPMTRAEFAKVVTIAVCRNLDTPSELPFQDVGPAAIAAPDLLQGIARAFAAGLMRGTTSTAFVPNSPIRLAQAMTVMVRTARAYLPGGLDPLRAGYSGAFSGFQDPQHGENARLAAANGLIADPELAYADPWVPLTRAEAAEMVWGLVIKFG